MARAEQSVDLYHADVLVTSQKASERAKAASDALAEVMVRVTGQRAALKHPNIVQALGRAQTYLHEYRYESTEQTLLAYGEQVPAISLALRFSEQAVTALIRQADLPLWPANRPSVLIWQVEDSLRGRKLVVDPARIAQLQALLHKRGLPVVMPLNDLQDHLLLSADDLWALDERRIRAASERYQSEAIVVLRHSRTSTGQWLATWQLYHGAQLDVFDGQAADLSQLYFEGVELIASRLAAHYSIVSSGDSPDRVTLELEGVVDFGRYVKSLEYLQSLPMVRQVDLLAVSGDKLTLQLATDGELSLLRNALQRDQRLLPVARRQVVELPGMNRGRPLPLGDVANPLRYQWPELSGVGGGLQ